MTDIVEKLRRRREMINRGHGDVQDIPDEDCMEAADEIERLRAALNEIEPYLEAIICYASTMDEHAPNRIAAAVHAALTTGQTTGK